ncbi:MAG TPA: hypothetical protein VJA66_03755, partial [Thermoanaerobaculia bacterium]
MRLWRLAGALALVSVTAAAAFVAASSYSRLSPRKLGGDIRATGELSEVRQGIWGNKQAIPGPSLEAGPTAAAEEDYENRALPAAYVPFDLTRAARTAWNAVKSQKGKNKQGVWTLAGP